MSRVLALSTAVVATSAVIGAPAVNAVAPIRVPLPNLTVSKGTVSLSHGRIKGSFTVANSGRASAGKSRAQLSIAVGKASKSLGVFKLAGLKTHAHVSITFSSAVPGGISAGKYHVVACADSTKVIRESSERDNCATIGTLTFTAASATSPTTATTPTTAGTKPAPTATPTPTATTPALSGPAATPTQPQPGPTQQPTSPMTVDSDTATLIQDSYNGMTGSYYVDVPPSYDTSGATPMRLLVWMHGCGGYAQGDAYETTSSNTLPMDAQGYEQPDDSRDFISISVGGTDGGCWNPDTDVEKVLMAVADATTHFNIDRRHIFIGGYSSGGDLAYRTIFYNADEFAGILTVNTNPFRDTGSTEAQSMAAASWKFNIAHVAHAQDEEYHVNPCSACLCDDNGNNCTDDPGVTPAMTDLNNAGYTVKYMIEPGTHSDPDDYSTNPHTGTDYDWRQYVRPFIDQAGWQSPG